MGSKSKWQDSLQSKIPIVEIAFKACYLIHLLMAFNALLAGEEIMKVTLVVVTVLGLLLGCYRLIYMKKYLCFPNIWYLAAFLGSYVLTAVVNIQYGLYESAQYFIWMIFQFGLLYAFDWTCDRKKVRREFHILAFILIAALTVYNLVGLGMMLKNYFTFHTAADGQIHLVGMAFWGRLFGLHADPNYGAVTSGAAIILAVYYLICAKKWWFKIVIGFTAAVQFLFVAFTLSRTGLVSVVIGITAFAGFYGWKLAKNRKLATAALIAFATAVVTLFSAQAITDGYNWMMGMQGQTEHVDPAESSQPSRISVNRQEELENDISNRRFDIWESAIQIFLSKPVTGVGFRNLVPYTKDHLPDAYIINNDMGDFDAMHNLVMDTLASQGIIGIVLLVAFIAAMIAFLIKNMKYVKEEHFLINAALFSCCLLMAVSSMFVSQVLYVNNPNTYIFWACLGYLVYSIKKDQEESKEIREAL